MKHDIQSYCKTEGMNSTHLMYEIDQANRNDRKEKVRILLMKISKVFGHIFKQPSKDLTKSLRRKENENYERV
ncbi:conserved protein of unknown function [Petrocella atlantisensis]|uniref:Uncharacterized protein n=1 Tax=Petrocella atlantisensis TaxID=2173034 RepID=A0A3P7NY39_9FIRM|nr:hypothetical protein [Petrocella atlantisensis]MCF8019646.1 hypothetical protein [Vallitaleaceae bacterium]VDN47885.1 conserved protein of unknown function [Petrocella atlantisensis]